MSLAFINDSKAVSQGKRIKGLNGVWRNASSLSHFTVRIPTKYIVIQGLINASVMIGLLQT